MKKFDIKFMAQLRKHLAKFEEVRATDGTELTVDGPIEVGKDILTPTEEGDYAPAPNGEYDLGDRIIVVEAGKITEIREVKPEDETPAEETPAETTTTEDAADEEPAEDTPAEETEDTVDKDSRIAELEARIAELEAENAALKEQLADKAAVPPTDLKKVEKETKPLAGQIIVNAWRHQ